MKIIDLLYKIANYDDDIPLKIKYDNYILEFDGNTYIDNEGDCLNEHLLPDLSNINAKVEILDEDIPLIPDDELYCLTQPKFCFENETTKEKRIDYNFRVLKEKLNQVIKEFNEFREKNK